MVKFPSQNRLTYQTGDIAYDNYSTITSGGTTGHLNLMKDLAIVNRRGYASTDRRGVPWVVRTKFDFFLHDEDGAYGPPSVLDNLMVTLKIDGCQNNWVMRNAAVKWHAAMKSMRKKAGIKNKQVGTYAHEIRYNYDANGDTWLTPIDGDGNAFAGGTWDATQFADEQDAAYSLKLVGLGVDEDTAAGLTAMQIGLSYLQSRSQVPADSNLESDETPAEHSHLLRLLSPVTENVLTDEITDFVQGQGDNPPYDEVTTEDVNHDITEPVELGRCLSSTQAAVGSAVVDIPFGICDLKARAYTSESTSGVASVRGLIQAEVLSIYPMQG